MEGGFHSKHARRKEEGDCRSGKGWVIALWDTLQWSGSITGGVGYGTISSSQNKKKKQRKRDLAGMSVKFTFWWGFGGGFVFGSCFCVVWLGFFVWFVLCVCVWWWVVWAGRLPTNRFVEQRQWQRSAGGNCQKRERGCRKGSGIQAKTCE